MIPKWGQHIKPTIMVVNNIEFGSTISNLPNWCLLVATRVSCDVYSFTNVVIFPRQTGYLIPARYDERKQMYDCDDCVYGINRPRSIRGTVCGNIQR